MGAVLAEPALSAILGGISSQIANVVTIGVFLDQIFDIKAVLYPMKEEVELAYISLDRTDAKYDIYANDIEEEKFINEVVNIARTYQTDPLDLFENMDGFLNSEYFSDGISAAKFESIFRDYLYLNKYHLGKIDEIVVKFSELTNREVVTLKDFMDVLDISKDSDEYKELLKFFNIKAGDDVEKTQLDMANVISVLEDKGPEYIKQIDYLRDNDLLPPSIKDYNDVYKAFDDRKPKVQYDHIIFPDTEEYNKMFRENLGIYNKYAPKDVIFSIQNDDMPIMTKRSTYYDEGTNEWVYYSKTYGANTEEYAEAMEKTLQNYSGTGIVNRVIQTFGVFSTMLKEGINSFNPMDDLYNGTFFNNVADMFTDDFEARYENSSRVGASVGNYQFGNDVYSRVQDGQIGLSSIVGTGFWQQGGGDLIENVAGSIFNKIIDFKEGLFAPLEVQAATLSNNDSVNLSPEQRDYIYSSTTDQSANILEYEENFAMFQEMYDKILEIYAIMDKRQIVQPTTVNITSNLNMNEIYNEVMYRLSHDIQVANSITPGIVSK